VSSTLERTRARPIRTTQITLLAEGHVVFLSCLLAYLATGIFLVFVGNVILGDALARVENIDRVLYSRDPHLAAIGFNFPPLPHLLYLPFLPLKSFWPPLVTDGFIGNIFSAVFMAGAVYQVNGFLADTGVKRSLRLALVATFALHPMILYSGANGMTEAPSLFFLLVAVRQLARWCRRAEVSAQVFTGVALSLAFLTRYEAVWAGLGAMALTALVTVHRQSVRGRIAAGLTDALVLGAPFMFTITGWIVANWVITGYAFAEISNAYGTAQLHIQGLQQVNGGHLWVQGLVGILTMEPLLPVIAIVASVVALHRRDLAFAAIVAVFVPILAFMYWGLATRNLLDSLRYLIVCVPLATLLCGVTLGSHDDADALQTNATVTTQDARSRVLRSARHIAGGAVTVAVLLMLATAAPIGALGMWRQQGSGALSLATIFIPQRATDDEKRSAKRWTTDRQVASYLDSQHLPPGAVLVDDFAGFAIFVQSDNQRQFVIASDRDFQATLADPASSGVEYVLVPQPKDILVLEAVNRTYPGFFDSGGGVAYLEREFPQVSDGPIWRLYRIRHS
jgi:hypothetical protein